MKEYVQAILPASLCLSILFLLTTIIFNGLPIQYNMILSILACILAAIFCSSLFYFLSPNKYHGFLWKSIRFLGMLLICFGIIFMSKRSIGIKTVFLDIIVFAAAYGILSILEFIKTKRDAEKINQKLSDR